MSFLFPRTISITRPGGQSGVGVQGYGGETKATETSVATAVPASIQMHRAGHSTDVRLPADGRESLWRIFFILGQGTVQNRDIITDDGGLRYQIVAAYWTPLGYNCSCVKLEA